MTVRMQRHFLLLRSGPLTTRRLLAHAGPLSAMPVAMRSILSLRRAGPETTPPDANRLQTAVAGERHRHPAGTSAEGRSAPPSHAAGRARRDVPLQSQTGRTQSPPCDTALD